MVCQGCWHPLDMHRRQASGAYRCISFGCGCERADTISRIQGGNEHAIISADRPVEYGTLDGNTIKVRS